jgi:hypothetical protein
MSRRSATIFGLIISDIAFSVLIGILIAQAGSALSYYLLLIFVFIATNFFVYGIVPPDTGKSKTINFRNLYGLALIVGIVSALLISTAYTGLFSSTRASAFSGGNQYFWVSRLYIT